ncbi:MAG: DUF4350 domain-containing protein [Acidobacteriota bacterium]|nr:DUF4350 domain-containing protein [Acidobacteriota bacterium]
MKGRLLIFLTVVVMVVLLVALNAASYVRVEQEGDTELQPDRSTLNAGGTGTLALFEYLQQRGVDVVRWRQPTSALADESEARPASLVIVGATRHEVERREAEDILRWVSQGGRLVLVDRSPTTRLLPATAGGWRVGSELVESPGPEVRTDDVEVMTRGVPLIAPAQPTALTRDVAEVTRSRFAGRLHVYQTDAAPVVGIGPGPPRSRFTPSPTPTPEEDDSLWGEEPEPTAQATPPPTPAAATQKEGAGGPAGKPDESAPVVHVGDGRGGALLVDYAYGRGRIVVLSDPYIVSNGGINRSDNLFLAFDAVTGGGEGAGRVAFDEYHQGYGATENRFFAYFRGTPVLWLFAQVGLVVLAVVWTRGRRFARATPAPRTDRRSKLEFVASMAELQQRARAYDLAVENIYQRTRRALARYGGVGANAPLEQLAERVAARSGRDPRRLEALLRECEDAMAGAPLNARRALALARELRELERDLRLLMRAREIRQAR